MGDFIGYIGQLFLTAWWNPDSILFSVFSWISTIYIFVFFFIPKLERKGVMCMVVLKRFRWVILFIAVLLSMVFASYTLQNTRGDWQLNRPYLSYQAEKGEVEILYDDDDNLLYFEIHIPLQNTGNSIAYDINYKSYLAPITNISVIDNQNSSDPNPLLPNGFRPFVFIQYQPYQKVDDQIQVASTTWYLKLEISYSDALEKGHNYSETYWFKLDYNIPDMLLSMTKQEATAFEAVIKGE